MVGLVHDLAHICGQAWRSPGDLIWLLGVPMETAEYIDPRISLAGSSYLECIHDAVIGRPPEVDLQLEFSVQAFLRMTISHGLVSSAHDLSDGGFAVAAAECCIASNLGAQFELPSSQARLDRLLFAEGGARILVSVAPSNAVAWQTALDQANSALPGSVLAQCLGVVTPDQELLITKSGETLVQISSNLLQECYEQSIPTRMGADPSQTL
jgi:phosphoribosylformylglycinamidine synthase